MPEPTKQVVDPAEAAADELLERWIVVDPDPSGDVPYRIPAEDIAAIIRRHTNDHLQRLHQTVMNLPTPKDEPGETAGDCCAMAYKYGHRDARHAAAEAIITSLD